MDELIKACENKISWRYWHSFTGNFEYYKKIDKKLVAKVIEDDDGIDKFIEICNNRRERAKTFLQDVATVLGFFGSSLAIVLTLSVLESGDKNHVDPFLDSISQYGILFTVLVFSLIGCIVILFVLLLHYRTSIHAWTAFKEMAILKKCPEKRD